MMGAQPRFFAPRESWGWALALRELDDETVLEAAVHHGDERWWTVRRTVPEHIPGWEITRQLTVIAQERGLLNHDDADRINQVTPRGSR
jgi:hypothetical protein